MSDYIPHACGVDSNAFWDDAARNEYSPRMWGSFPQGRVPYQLVQDIPHACGVISKAFYKNTR